MKNDGCFRIPAGKDTFVVGGPWADKPMQDYVAKAGDTGVTSKNDLLVKYDIVYPQFNRIAVIGFGLSSISHEQLLGARLKLSIVPNDLQ